MTFRTFPNGTTLAFAKFSAVFMSIRLLRPVPLKISWMSRTFPLFTKVFSVIAPILKSPIMKLPLMRMASPLRPSPSGSLIPDGTGQGKEVTYTYRVFRPLTVYFIKQMKQQFAIYFSVTPVDDLHCLGWMCMAMNYGFDIPEAQLIAFQDEVTAQDIPIVESQRPERLPLRFTGRIALAFRPHQHCLPQVAG